MNAMLAIIIIFIIILVLGILAFIFIRYFSKLKEIPPNQPLLISLDKTRTGGYALGVIIDTDFKLGDRGLITFKPLDIPYNEKGEPENREPFTCAIRKEKCQEIPAGGLSQNRAIVIIFPDNSSDLDSVFRNTPFGKGISAAIETIDIIDNALNMAKKKQMMERRENAMFEFEQSKINILKDDELKKMAKEQRGQTLISQNSEKR